MEDSYIVDIKDRKRKSELNANNSYRIIDQKIVLLKKLEFDYNHFIEVLNDYLIAQEVIVKNLFGEVEVIIINI